MWVFHCLVWASHPLLCFLEDDHLNSNGSSMLVGNFISRIPRIQYNVDSNREKLPKLKDITLTSNLVLFIDLSVLSPDNYSNESVGLFLKFYWSKYPEKLMIGHINISVIRNKSEILKSILSDVLDILMITKTKLDDSFPE